MKTMLKASADSFLLFGVSDKTGLSAFVLKKNISNRTLDFKVMEIQLLSFNIKVKLMKT